MNHPPPHETGFTLVEMSIVMVIIGLIIGGVLVGKDMIRGAQLRKQAADLHKWAAAFNVFRDKYNGIPGDMVNHLEFFTYGTVCSLCSGYTANNNGRIDNWSTESRLAVAQLNVAGLAPPPFADSLYYFRSIDNSITYFYSNDLYNQTPARNRNSITVANICAPWIRAGVLTGDDARRLDSKIDDGAPNGGNVYGINGYSADGLTMYTCADAVLTNTYGNLTDTDTKRCRILYWLD